MRVCALVLTLSLAGVFSASAQSLADVARKENDRRQTVKEPGGKTWTNQDLKPVPAAPTEETPAAATDPAASEPPADSQKAGDDTAAGGKKAPTGEEKAEEVKDQKYWSSRMAELRARLERDETFRDALQSRVDALTADFVNRDDPAQRSQIALDREKALSELDRVKKSIEQGRRAIPELEEEARREGVPAGWLR
ncbi:MAG: hypothetical protein AB7H96_21945 [Vicinamibacterales bacterium]